MSIDKQRIAAVKTLEALGYTWKEGTWEPAWQKEAATWPAAKLEEAARELIDFFSSPRPTTELEAARKGSEISERMRAILAEKPA